MGNIYYSPEAHGLKIMWQVEKEPDYDFDMCVVWKDREGRLYWAQDSGCSCPCPFEDYFSVNDLAPLTEDSFGSFRDAVHSGYGYSASDKADILNKVRRALRRRT